MSSAREAIQSIFIKQTETRHDPKAYIAYRIDIQASVRQWHIWKRYSDFTKLYDQLAQTFPQNQIPAQLPQKRIFPPTIRSSDRIEERRRGLEEFLRTILGCRDDRWRKTDIWNDFLALPAATSPVVSATSTLVEDQGQITIGSWLDEYDQLFNLTRDIRSFINSRNAHQSQQEVSDAMQCEVKAKKGLMNLNARLSILEKSLFNSNNGKWMAEGEERRREDKLTRLKQERDVLVQLVNVTRQDLVKQMNKRSSSDRYIQRKEDEGYGDIGFDIPVSVKRAQTTANTKSLHNKIGGGRAFGTALLKQQQKQIQETEKTKGLDNQELLNYQNQIMKDQDLHIEQFSQILGRQKEIGFAISNELESQVQILESLEVQVDKTATKLAFANKKLAKIN